MFIDDHHCLYYRKRDFKHNSAAVLLRLAHHCNDKKWIRLCGYLHKEHYGVTCLNAESFSYENVSSSPEYDKISI